MKPIIVWICPYCYSKHVDKFVRCVGCGTKRSIRFSVDADEHWLTPFPTAHEHETRRCLADKHSTKGEK
jgi:hypothetical protein